MNRKKKRVLQVISDVYLFITKNNVYFYKGNDSIDFIDCKIRKISLKYKNIKVSFE